MAEDATDERTVEVYCDGSCEPNPGTMRVGVWCESPSLQITRSVGQGTNNIAECLAAVVALEACQKRGINGFTLFSDSLLLCNWVSGRYRCRSITAQQYVPTVQRLLGQVGGSLRWCPGETNPADALSRDLSPSRNGSRSSVSYLATTPMESLRFKDFAGLKVGGRDEFSRLRLPQLRELVPEHATVAESFDVDADIASCLRWMLRGLPLEKAIRKVRTDLEIAENAKGVRYDN